MTRPRPPDFLATPTTPCPKSGVVATPGLTPLRCFVLATSLLVCNHQRYIYISTVSFCCRYICWDGVGGNRGLSLRLFQELTRVFNSVHCYHPLLHWLWQ